MDTKERTKKKTRKKTRKKTAKTNRIYIGFFVFFSLLFYLLGSVWTLAKKPSVPLEIAVLGFIEEKYTAKGIIIRDEHVISSPKEGFTEYFYAEGEKVGRNDLLGTIQDKEFFSIVQRQLDQVDRNIQKTQEQRKEIQWFQKDINQLNNKIYDTLNSQYQLLYEKEDFNLIYNAKEEVQKLISKRNQLLLLEPKGRMKDLVTEKMQYENQLKQNSTILAAPISGILSYQLDEFETITKDTIRLEHFQMEIQQVQLNQGDEVKADKPIMKIVQDTGWYIAGIFPNEIVAKWTVGQRIKLQFPQKNYLEIPFSISMIKPTEDQNLVIFESQEYMHLFLNDRILDFQVLIESHEGIKVANSAIIEKSFLKIPKASLIESGKETGVIRLAGEESVFVGIAISYEDDQNIYVPTGQDLRQYDTVMIQKGERQEKYILEEIETSTGLFIANEGFAKFKKIEILGYNQNYTIIRSTTPFGVQVYDRIVLDATQVEDNQFLHKSS
ncbi:MAG: hypothetical protein GX962_04595 [Epulopiscium sp.]|nr:hypothetical protein [Candidatus Epulonipiscium sp.]